MLSGRWDYRWHILYFDKILKFSTKYMHYGIHLTWIQCELGPEWKESRSSKRPTAEEPEGRAKVLRFQQICHIYGLERRPAWLCGDAPDLSLALAFSGREIRSYWRVLSRGAIWSHLHSWKIIQVSVWKKVVKQNDWKQELSVGRLLHKSRQSDGFDEMIPVKCLAQRLTYCMYPELLIFSL